MLTMLPPVWSRCGIAAWARKRQASMLTPMIRRY
jgi:hypothetical protein